jgi:hypothetical protein
MNPEPLPFQACDAVRSVLALGMDKAMTAVNNKK